MIEASEGKPLERSVLKQEANRLIGKTKEILRQNSDFAKAVLARFLDNPNLGAEDIRFATNYTPYQVTYKTGTASDEIQVSRYEHGNDNPVEEARITIGKWIGDKIQYTSTPFGEAPNSTSNNQAAIDGARRLINSLKPPRETSQ